MKKTIRNASGFTLVEIMIVVAIIALLAAIAVPNFLRARKRSQATRILEDMRLIQAAVDQYAIEYNKASGQCAAWADVQMYLKTGSQLYNANHADLFGHSYGTQFEVDGFEGIPSVLVPMSTYNALADVAPVDFWSPYYNATYAQP